MAFEGLWKQPPTKFKITEMYAWIARDPQDGNEGVVTAMTRVGPVPLIAADKTRVDETRKLAQEFATLHGVPIRLARFTAREDLERIAP